MYICSIEITSFRGVRHSCIMCMPPPFDFVPKFPDLTLSNAWLYFSLLFSKCIYKEQDPGVPNLEDLELVIVCLRSVLISCITCIQTFSKPLSVFFSDLFCAHRCVRV